MGNDVNVLCGHTNLDLAKPKLTCNMLQIPMHKSTHYVETSDIL